MCSNVRHGVYVKVRGQLSKVSCFLPPYGMEPSSSLAAGTFTHGVSSMMPADFYDSTFSSLWKVTDRRGRLKKNELSYKNQLDISKESLVHIFDGLYTLSLRSSTIKRCVPVGEGVSLLVWALRS